MIILEDLVQGSDEWLQARLGIPTASCFGQIVTTKGKESASRWGYMAKLLKEFRTGVPSDFYMDENMENGMKREPEGRDAYAFVTGVDVKEVGLIYLDERKLVSASPDGLINKDGGLELKCPKEETFLKYMLEDRCPTTYVQQVQGNLWISGREWWDFSAYYPGYDSFIHRVYRDEFFIRELSVSIDIFIDIMLEEREKLPK